ncbi:serine/threonine-protein kinase [Pseudonocardia tropica]|uniref:non-specific serine/threonine protein kinase n=1 Tax=Pseudonocardia tropica TaxID=681289 RepID=A0ABV1JMM6_9PSEU
MVKVSSSHDPQFVVGPEGEARKYTLIRQIGSGGEATLWEATVSVAGQPETVAVKVLRAEHVEDIERFSSRWSEQAELLRFVRHPSVVGVREHFRGPAPHLRREDDERATLYLVMNWVDGRSFDEWVVLHDGNEGALDGLRLLEQVADALDELHSGRVTPSERPLIHGDLSPRNVMITEKQQAVVVDFGLARVAAHQTRMAFGTPGYAAPEVWQQGRYSPASDRYAFAALGFFALVGQSPPQNIDEIHQQLFAHPLLARTPVPQQEEIMRGFAGDPAQRPSARAWLTAVRGGATASSRRLTPTAMMAAPTPTWVGTHPSASAPSGRKAPNWLAWGAALLVLIIGGGYLLSLGSNRPTSSAAPPGTTASSGTGVGATASRSPSSTRSAPEPTVRRTSVSPITLEQYYGVDLDSMQPNWDVARSTISDGPRDLVYSESLQGDDDGSVSGQETSPVTGPVEYPTCEAATSYTTRRKVSAGDRLCVRTSDYRYALVQVRGAGKGSIAFDVVVWDPPYKAG